MITSLALMMLAAVAGRIDRRELARQVAWALVALVILILHATHPPRPQRYQVEPHVILM